MIAASHLTRSFGTRVAVEDATFDVRPGEIFGLLGPNGAGKTTTLRMLAGLLAPSSGEATVAGIRLSRETIDQVRARIGFLTESPGLWDRLTVRQNLMVYARLHQLSDPVRHGDAGARTVRPGGSRRQPGRRAVEGSEAAGGSGPCAAARAASRAARRADVRTRSAERSSGARPRARLTGARSRGGAVDAQPVRGRARRRSRGRAARPVSRRGQSRGSRGSDCSAAVRSFESRARPRCTSGVVAATGGRDVVVDGSTLRFALDEIGAGHARRRAGAGGGRRRLSWK